MTALIIPVFNRPTYVKQCFDSILAASLPGDLEIYVVDDCSTDDGIRDVIAEFANELGLKGVPYYILGNLENKGVRGTLLKGFEHAFKCGCDKIINLDSDAIVKPNFVQVLTGFLDRYKGTYIVSGFNCKSEGNPVLFQDIVTGDDDFVHKALCNGINMCFTREHYDKYIFPALNMVGNWDYNTSLACKRDGIPFIITTPSVVQHIGVKSSMGHGEGVKADVAYDF